MKRILSIAIIALVITSANATNLPKSNKLDRIYTKKECEDLNLLIEVKRQELHDLLGVRIKESKYEKMIRELLDFKKEYKRGCENDS